jgi:Tfp pilus assembly protein PilN
MLALNIIPEELKKEMVLKKLIRSTRIVLVLLSASTLIYTVILFGSRIILEGHRKDISTQNIIVTKNTDNYSKQVKEINKQVSAIATIQQNNIYWSPLIKSLFNNIPDDIKLSRVNFNKPDSSLTIAGIAGTRNSLINLRQYLENNSNFSVASFPVQNLIEKQNISFDIKLQIKSFSVTSE